MNKEIRVCLEQSLDLLSTIINYYSRSLTEHTIYFFLRYFTLRAFVHYRQHHGLKAQICNYTVKSNTKNYAKTSIAIILTTAMTLLQCFRFTLMGTSHIQVGSILTLSLITQYYTKSQPKFDTFDE